MRKVKSEVDIFRRAPGAVERRLDRDIVLGVVNGTFGSGHGVAYTLGRHCHGACHSVSLIVSGSRSRGNTLSLIGGRFLSRRALGGST